MAIHKFMSNDVENIVTSYVADEIRKQLTESIIEAVRKDVEALVEDYTRKLVVKVSQHSYLYDKELKTNITIDFNKNGKNDPNQTTP